MPNLIQRIFSGVSKEVKTTEPVNLYVRESVRKPGVLVIGAEFNGDRKRIALVRANDDDTFTVRTLNGNPREASSRANTQTKLVLSVDELTDDEAFSPLSA